MEDIRDVLQIRDVESNYQPQILAQPNEPHHSTSNQSHVAIDDQELLQLQAAQMFYSSYSFQQKQDHLAKVYSLLDHHRMIVEILQGMKDVCVLGLKDHEVNPKIAYTQASILEAKNVLFRSQNRH